MNIAIANSVPGKVRDEGHPLSRSALIYILSTRS